ncbi:glycosyltransferase family 2 protein [Halospina sp. K52047b]|uniref:glycosyltransferase family 2 protein n=1 Tax=Halospina sp. K52047b TaxID=2614160 RepID=UPI001249E68D|nr:glycosyltransferase family 2 protein [Halospina sp. K52047b]KAA8981267.1 glycosyltransferase [Halospina sp. K52047b]
MITFIFSYNRGPHLQNCVESVEYCAPDSTIIIYDDNSDDPETRRILKDLTERHEVRKPGSLHNLSMHGGLYNNMQHALYSVETHDEIICFLQDDTQMVRPIKNEDRSFIKNYFASNPKAGFIAPVFQKGHTRKKTLERFRYAAKYGVYFCHHESNKNVAGMHYSDISITLSGRLKEVQWCFHGDEYDNEQQARQHFMKMGYLYAPFVMWLPNPPAYRNKGKTLAFQIAERRNRAGLYPYRFMTEERISALTTRDPAQLPIAEQNLELTTVLEKPWIFHPLKRSRLLRKLDRLQTFFQHSR